MAWVNVAAEGRGGGADATLATVLGYVGANVVTPSPIHLAVERDAVGPDGLIADGGVRTALREILRRVAEQVPAPVASRRVHAAIKPAGLDPIKPD